MQCHVNPCTIQIHSHARTEKQEGKQGEKANAEACMYVKKGRKEGGGGGLAWEKEGKQAAGSIHRKTMDGIFHNKTMNIQRKRS